MVTKVRYPRSGQGLHVKMRKFDKAWGREYTQVMTPKYHASTEPLGEKFNKW